MRFFYYLLFFFALSALNAQPQNSIALNISSVYGNDQSVIRFGMSGTSSFDSGPDMEKVFPSNMNNPTIFTVDADTVIYTINTMSIESIEDTLIPIYIQNALAGSYQIQIGDVAPLASFVDAYITIPSTGDTLQYSGSLNFNLNLSSNAEYSLSEPTFYFHFGVSYNLDMMSIQSTDVSCPDDLNGLIEIQAPIENVKISVYDENNQLIEESFSSLGLNTIDSLHTGTYRLFFRKGVSSKEEFVSIGSINDQTFDIDLLSIDPISFSAEMEVTNQNFDIINWDFGDNSNANGQYVNHFFPGNGAYNVVLSVESAGCAFTDSLTLDFNSYLEVNEQKSELAIHYSESNGLKLFKENQVIEEYRVYSLDGRMIDQGSKDITQLPYLGSSIIFKYKTRINQQWNSAKLIALD